MKKDEMSVEGSEQVGVHKLMSALGRMCKVCCEDWHGTGFLVTYQGREFMMTNFHVLPRSDECRYLMFNYHDDASPGDKVGVDRKVFFSK